MATTGDADGQSNPGQALCQKTKIPMERIFCMAGISKKIVGAVIVFALIFIAFALFKHSQDEQHARAAKHYREDIGPSLKDVQRVIKERIYENRGGKLQEPLENEIKKIEAIRKQYRNTPVEEKVDTISKNFSLLLNDMEISNAMFWYPPRNDSLEREVMEQKFNAYTIWIGKLEKDINSL